MRAISWPTSQGFLPLLDLPFIVGDSKLRRWTSYAILGIAALLFAYFGVGFLLVGWWVAGSVITGFAAISIIGLVLLRQDQTSVVVDADKTVWLGLRGQVRHRIDHRDVVAVEPITPSVLGPYTVGGLRLTSNAGRRFSIQGLRGTQSRELAKRIRPPPQGRVVTSLGKPTPRLTLHSDGLDVHPRWFGAPRRVRYIDLDQIWTTGQFGWIWMLHLRGPRTRIDESMARFSADDVEGFVAELTRRLAAAWGK